VHLDRGDTRGLQQQLTREEDCRVRVRVRVRVGVGVRVGVRLVREKDCHAHWFSGE